MPPAGFPEGKLNLRASTNEVLESDVPSKGQAGGLERHRLLQAQPCCRRTRGTLCLPFRQPKLAEAGSELVEVCPRSIEVGPSSADSGKRLVGIDRVRSECDRGWAKIGRVRIKIGRCRGKVVNIARGGPSGSNHAEHCRMRLKCANIHGHCLEFG